MESTPNISSIRLSLKTLCDLVSSLARTDESWFALREIKTCIQPTNNHYWTPHLEIEADFKMIHPKLNVWG